MRSNRSATVSYLGILILFSVSLLSGCGGGYAPTPSNASKTPTSDRSAPSSMMRARETTQVVGPGGLNWTQFTTNQGTTGYYIAVPASTGGGFLYYGPDGVLYRDNHSGEVYPGEITANRIGIASSFPFVTLFPTLPPLPTVSVDVRQYMAAAISNGSAGQMLCANATVSTSCITSYYGGDANGEVVIAYGNGIIDYIGITSATGVPGGGIPFTAGYPYTYTGVTSPRQYIGVIRNYPTGGDPLRCFTTLSSCTAPASGFPLEGMPYIIDRLPVVSWATVAATENDTDPSQADAYPIIGIPGAMTTTPNTSDQSSFWYYNVLNFDANCAQHQNFRVGSINTVIYVTGVPFGGQVGTQDAIVTDGVSNGNPSFLERYYYVKGFGRVREDISAQVATSPYGIPVYGKGNFLSNNSDRSSVLPLNLGFIPFPASHGGCPQGSAEPIF